MREAFEERKEVVTRCAEKYGREATSSSGAYALDCYMRIKGQEHGRNRDVSAAEHVGSWGISHNMWSGTVCQINFSTAGDYESEARDVGEGR